MARVELLEKDPELAARIVRNIRSGASQDRAARAEGIKPDTFAQWLTKGRHDPKAKQIYRDLVELVDGGKDAGIVANLRTIELAAYEDWRAAAWLLAVKDPDTYGKRQIVNVGGAKGSPPIRHEHSEGPPAVDFATWDPNDVDTYIELGERYGFAEDEE